MSLAMYQDLLTKYHDLVKEVATMRRDGFVPMPADQPAPVQATLPKRVSEAIQEIVEAAGYDADLERALTSTAWMQIRHGMDEQAVADAIREGEPIDA